MRCANSRKRMKAEGCRMKDALVFGFYIVHPSSFILCVRAGGIHHETIVCMPADLVGSGMLDIRGVAGSFAARRGNGRAGTDAGAGGRSTTWSGNRARAER